MSEERLTAGSLFSGVGGIDLGAERAGFRTEWTAEIDPQARSILRARFPEAEHLEDVRHVGAEKGPVDLLSGGFPCQDLSVAGRRAGLAGERSGLWFEFRRVIAETTPTWVLVENVPGLLSSNGGEDFAVLLEGLAGWRPKVPEEGGWRNSGWITSPFGRLYGAVWRVLDTQNFGIPQRRRRVFVVARLGGVCPPEVLLEPEGLPWNTPPSREAREGATRNTRIGPLCARDYKGVGTQYVNEGKVVAHTLCGEGFDASEDGTGRGTPIVAHPPPVDAAVPRRITPRETERLQGFPDDWTRWDDKGNALADGPRYRMIGNAVTVAVAHWICSRVRACHEGRDPDEASRDLSAVYAGATSSSYTQEAVE